jgi:hypothetical protein
MSKFDLSSDVEVMLSDLELNDSINTNIIKDIDNLLVKIYNIGYDNGMDDNMELYYQSQFND